MKIDIITIGDEILIGQVVDTNSAWMGQFLNENGFEINRITSISDDAKEIKETVDEAFCRSEIILMTGGLGPTKDDITKTTLCEYFNSTMVFNQEVHENIERLLAGRVSSLNKQNQSQAFVPECCNVIPNPVGTAPVMWFEIEGKVLVSMPGVPSEMKYAMVESIVPLLKKKYQTSEVVHKTVLTYGIPEAVLAEYLEEWEEKLPHSLKLAYLPAMGKVRLRLTGRGNDKGVLLRLIDETFDQLPAVVTDAIYGCDEEQPAEIVGCELNKRGWSFASAESCTGGTISQLMTAVPGASAYVKGAVVAYDNAVKTNVLHVSQNNLDVYGAVSQQVVEQMAKGVMKLLNCDVAVATSGVAGPTGGTDDKPVGTVWIAFAGPWGVKSEVFRFGNNRERTVVRSAETALIKLLNEIKKWK